MSRDEDLSRVLDRPNLDRARALVNDEIERIENEVRKQIFAAIRQGTLEPQQALQAWLRIESADKLRNALVRRTRQAQSAGQRVGPDMEQGPGGNQPE